MHSNSISTKNKWQKIASIGRTDNIMAAAHQSKKQLKKLKWYFLEAEDSIHWKEKKFFLEAPKRYFSCLQAGCN
ncbi:hypothetical protein V6N13_090115 [Hibiscus sabdariffa]